MADPINPFDVAALEKSINDSATRVSTIWVTYLLFGLYLVTAVSNVTQRQLFLDESLKLPVLNIDLPLIGFFFLAPILFLLLHVYVLIQFLLLARTAAVYNDALLASVSIESDRTRIRQRLANTLFAQILAGSPREREGLLGFLLKMLAWCALVIAPALILLAFLVTFLPYHSHLITWTHRILFAADLLAVVTLWSAALDPTKDIKLYRPWSLFGILVLFSLVSVLVTFPSEIHSGWMKCADAGQADSSEQANRCRLRGIMTLLRGPSFDRLELPGEDFVDDDALRKIEETTKARGQEPFSGQRTHTFDYRDLTCGNFDGTDLRRSSFDNAKMAGARLNSAALDASSIYSADLRGASLAGTHLEEVMLDRSSLQGANLTNAQLVDSSLERVTLQGARALNGRLSRARFNYAQLQGVNFTAANLQGTEFFNSNLQGSTFARALLATAGFKQSNLQGADFVNASMQGAWFLDVQLQGASFRGARLQGVVFDMERNGLQLTDFSTSFLYRAFSKNCNGAQVVDPNLDAVVGLGASYPLQTVLPEKADELIERIISFGVSAKLGCGTDS
jgi:uncharacterized protein YjbI with pentapeptide repeats